MSNTLTVSIVLYKNNEDQVMKAIQSVLETTVVDILYLIDNSPTNSLKSLASDKRIIYIFNNKNVGFGAGHNIVLDNSLNLGRYHLVLNPDTYFEKGVLESITEYLDSNPDIGLLMPKILYPDKSTQYLPKLIPTPFSVIKRNLPIPTLIKKWILNNYELRFINENNSVEVPMISGCFSFFRTSVFEKIGTFDDRFFMYFEDVDISRRVGRHFKTIFYQKVFIYHSYERGAQKNLRLFIIFIISYMKYFNKWGWLFDAERIKINKTILEKVKNV